MAEKSPPREDTRRAALFDMLRRAGKRGVSFDRLHAECGFKNRKSTLAILWTCWPPRTDMA